MKNECVEVPLYNFQGAFGLAFQRVGLVLKRMFHWLMYFGANFYYTAYLQVSSFGLLANVCRINRHMTSACDRTGGNGLIWMT